MAKEKKELIVGVNGDLSDNFTTGQKAILGLQNTLAMCGVILVPILCGLDVSVTLFCAGIGTIIYQFIDKKMVPAFLGGSFAIMPVFPPSWAKWAFLMHRAVFWAWRSFICCLPCCSRSWVRTV